MLNTRLIEELQNFRTNDVGILVPMRTPTQRWNMFYTIRVVRYDPSQDYIMIETLADWNPDKTHDDANYEALVKS